MFRESTRIARVQPPIIPIVGDLIRQTPGAISLGQGIVSWGPPPEALAELSRLDSNPELHRYNAVFGLPELIDEITKKLREENRIPVDDKRRVFVTAGGNMAFYNALLAVADPGDEIILPAPYYFNHEMAITMANARCVPIPVDEDLQPRVDDISDAVTSRTRAVVTVSPNNPTGAVYRPETLGEINELCRERSLYHISDEAYEHFTFDGAVHFSPASIPGAEGHTISLFSMSKSYGMAGWRTGYMIAPSHLVEAINKIQDTILICPPAPSQLAAIGALRGGREYLQRNLSELAGTRARARAMLEPLSKYGRIAPAGGALYYWIELNTGHQPLAIVERLVREHRVAVIPGSAFGDAGNNGVCRLRVSFGALAADQVAEGIGRLVAGVEKILGG
ncbi:MAG: pyridoxal phosphate-dependent aminotransferase [Acidobacteria bacterium]|nr:pyridoxal phosphate-dependent aminotransferase [Acidobacteriota bacterium]MCW5967686.1 pyridoxal phosphate-dependent aminotransferase [Blastocatellales bacterium]